MTIPRVAELTLEEKASLTSGASFWYTRPVERVGVPAVICLLYTSDAAD